MEILVGTGGWTYLPIESEDKLRLYSQFFQFVEVNSTFYHYPKLSTVRSWRRRVSKYFKFSVKCHQDATHKFNLRPVEGTFKALERMFEVCKLLRSDMLVLQTPPSMFFNDVVVKDVGTIFETLKLPNIRLIWEVRQREGRMIPDELLSLMAELNIVRVIDLTREDPPEEQDLIYSRLFGSTGGSIYPFSDEEMDNIERRLSKSSATRAVLSFHGGSMYADAVKFMERIKSKT